MKKPRLATVLYTILIAFVLILLVLRINHQLSTESFWRLYSLNLVLGILVRRLPVMQAKKA
jgi:hypothetical protein